MALSLLAVLAGLAAAYTLQARVSLLTTHGVSMKPHFNTGDLAVTARSDHYRVGDIVAYRSTPNNAIVLHRIVKERDGHFTFKGDNNTWLDHDRPTTKEIVGRLWIRIPRAGVVADFTTAPGHTVFLVLGILILLAGGGSASKRKSRSRKDGTARAPTRPLATRDDLREAGSTLGPAVAVIVIAAIVGMAAFSRPATRSANVKRSYEQSTSYSYEAEAPIGPTYPDGLVTTGTPIFLRLVDRVTFTIAYRFDAKDLHGVSGAYSLDARISGIGSWKGYLPLQPKTRFTGSGFSTEFQLDIAAAQAMIAATQAETGLRGDNVIIEVVPHITVRGFDGDAPVSAEFDTPLALKVTPLDVSLVKAPTGTDSKVGASSKGSYRVPVERPRNLSFVGRTLSVERGRSVAVAGLLGGGLWLAVAWVTMQRLHRKPEPDRIAHRYGESLVEVDSVPDHLDAVDVADMAALARIAERNERMILHHCGEDEEHTYLVGDGPTTFRYRVTVAPRASPATPVNPAWPSNTPTEATAATELEWAPPPDSFPSHHFWDSGTPPPYAGTPPPLPPAPPAPPVDLDPLIQTQSLDEALRLGPVTEAEAAAFGVSEPEPGTPERA